MIPVLKKIKQIQKCVRYVLTEWFSMSEIFSVNASFSQYSVWLYDTQSPVFLDYGNF